MDWVEQRARLRTALIVGGVSALHAVFLGWALSSNISPDSVSIGESILVEFAERPPELSPANEPAEIVEQRGEPRPETPRPVKQTDARVRDDAASGPTLENNQPSVLTRNAPSQKAIATAPDTGSNARLSEAQVAEVFKQLDCQKLKDQRRADCPETDSFTATIMAGQRREVAPKVWADSSYINRPVTEQFFKREADARLNWPDADLFADPMAAGADDAQRIRNAREPLWSKEMRDGFRRTD